MSRFALNRGSHRGLATWLARGSARWLSRWLPGRVIHNRFDLRGRRVFHNVPSAAGDDVGIEVGRNIGPALESGHRLGSPR